MCTQLQPASRRPSLLSVALERANRTIVLAASISLVGLGAISATRAAAIEPPDASDEATDDGDASVLIATRAADDAQQPATIPDDDGDDSLQPISQISEHTPELADLTSMKSDELAPRPEHVNSKAAEASPKSDDAKQFGSALAKVAGNGKKAADKATDPSADGASTDLGAAYRTGIAAEPAKFNGIQPGTSTKKDVTAAWGAPVNTSKNGDTTVLTYQTDPFKSIDVLITEGKVSAIKIELQGTLPPKRLAKQLSLDKIDSAVVSDEKGIALGESYPERGVLFIFAPADESNAGANISPAPKVTHVVIQPLDANAFALRAESRLHGPYEQNIRDLEMALKLDSEMAQAHWLLADIYLATGQADKAESESAAALEVEPDNSAYQLRHAEALELVGRYDDAVREVRTVLDRGTTAPVVKAQAFHAMAALATLGEKSIASKAVSFDTKAIEIADSLATSKNVKERRAAKQVLIEAHLSIARAISHQEYKGKTEAISEWIGRASGLAEGAISTDGGSLELRLLVARQALGALASMKPTKDPAAFVTEAQDTANALKQQYDDDLWQRRIKWELGEAYYHAVRIELVRNETSTALRYGQSAIENLADGAETRQAVHDSELLVGQLYFQIGAIYAVLKQDHKSAAQWYDKAVPLLTAPQPVSDLLTPQLEGEELVSMGVSYWQVGEKDRALDLTLNGATMTQQAVDRGVLPKSSLAVPYGNLATMYKQLGQVGDAAKYAELARVAGAGEKPKDTADDGTSPATSPRASSKPNKNQGPARKMAAGANPNGAKPIHSATAGTNSAAQHARPGQPYNNVGQSKPTNPTNQNGNSGQPPAGEEVARREKPGTDGQLTEPQMR
jgi:tetratricopeptide (TPR) repeat protein